MFLIRASRKESKSKFDSGEVLNNFLCSFRLVESEKRKILDSFLIDANERTDSLVEERDGEERGRGKWARPGRNIALGMLMREGKDVKEWNVSSSFLLVSRERQVHYLDSWTKREKIYEML